MQLVRILLSSMRSHGEIYSAHHSISSPRQLLINYNRMIGLLIQRALYIVQW